MHGNAKLPEFVYEKKDERKTAEIILDIGPSTPFKDGESKTVSVWSWRLMKHIKYVVRFYRGKFIISLLE